MKLYTFFNLSMTLAIVLINLNRSLSRGHPLLVRPPITSGEWLRGGGLAVVVVKTRATPVVAFYHKPAI